jgi:hypothetical protein
MHSSAFSLKRVSFNTQDVTNPVSLPSFLFYAGYSRPDWLYV